jgi:hypothetical protein
VCGPNSQKTYIMAYLKHMDNCNGTGKLVE